DRPLGEQATVGGRTKVAMTLYVAGHWDDARRLFERLAREEPRAIEHRGYLGVLAARSGHRTEAPAVDTSLGAPRGPRPPGRHPRFERGTFGSGGRRSIQLSYWRDFDVPRRYPPTTPNGSGGGCGLGTGRAVRARAEAPQIIVRVHAGGVPVAPLELDCITADRLDRHGMDVRDLVASVLPLAHDAATVLTEVAGSVHSLVPVAPADPHVPLVGARDC